MAENKKCNEDLLERPTFFVNTSNPGKQKDFERLFAGRAHIHFSHQDLAEVDSDVLTVAVQKASQFDGQKQVIVEDSALFIEGADVGVNIRWLLDSLGTLKGRRATWTVHLAYRKGHEVFVFKGEVHGHIVEARGSGFGFDSVFQPDGSKQTLGEFKPDQYSARAKAVENLISNHNPVVVPAIDHWTGSWQHPE